MKRILPALFFTSFYLQGFSQFCLKPAVIYNSGTNPVSLCVADFNSDGKQDLAVTNSANNNVSVYPGTGTGAFSAAISYNTGFYPYLVVSADFNGDTKADLAVSNFGNNTISVLLNSGSGSFGSATNYVAGSSPTGLCTGDFNADNIIDLAVTCNNTVCIMTGSGTGAFALAASYPMGINNILQYVSCADFNADGKADLVVADMMGFVHIFLGNGNGTFGTPATISVPTDPMGVVTGDFNADGKKDLAVSHSNSNTVSFLFGNGNGNFSAPANYNVGSGAAIGSTGDFDGDGDEDFVSSNVGGNYIGVLLNNGNGTFKPYVEIPTIPSGAHTIFAGTGDFNGDGRSDVAAVNYNMDNLNIFLSGALPVISIAPPTPSVCGGNNITLSASGATSYSWTSLGLGASMVVAPLSNSIYTVTGGTPGCTSPATVEVTVDAFPFITLLPASQNTICEGENIVVSATGADSYTWMPAGTVASSFTFSPSSSANYPVIGSSPKGCRTIVNLSIAVDPCTGLGAPAGARLLQVYPNPSSGLLIVELNQASSLEIRDVSGKTIQTATYAAGKQSLDLSTATKGLYFLTISTGAAQQTLKLIVE